MNSDVMFLAGDIGATKTNLSVCSFKSGPKKPLAEATFQSKDFTSLEELVKTFLARMNVTVDSACFGAAGPVIGGQIKVTNLPWVINAKSLKTELHLKSVHLLNDLEAIAHAVTHLEASDVLTLNIGHPQPEGVVAVIAPGTGLGEAYLTWDGKRYRAHASEGGHADFAPRNALEIGLLSFLLERIEHVDVERVSSGLGIPNIYDYLKHRGEEAEPPWLAESLKKAEDPTIVISQAAMETDDPCALCVRTLETFVSILAAEAGNLALKVLATGGVYLGGGIPPRVLPFLKDPRFLASFRSKDRLSSLLEQIPVHVILNSKVGLLGAAYRGLDLE